MEPMTVVNIGITIGWVYLFLYSYYGYDKRDDNDTRR